MKLRELNKGGLEVMEQFLDSLTGAAPLLFPEHLLEDPATSQLISDNIDVFPKTSSRLLKKSISC